MPESSTTNIVITPELEAALEAAFEGLLDPPNASHHALDELSAPGHALRRALDQLQTLDLVRTIEGGA